MKHQVTELSLEGFRVEAIVASSQGKRITMITNIIGGTGIVRFRVEKDGVISWYKNTKEAIEEYNK